MAIAALKSELLRLLMPTLQQGNNYPMFQMTVQVSSPDPFRLSLLTIFLFLYRMRARPTSTLGRFLAYRGGV
jgi:hypothetical protein